MGGLGRRCRLRALAYAGNLGPMARRSVASDLGGFAYAHVLAVVLP
jgi:hypothetical protein